MRTSEHAGFAMILAAIFIGLVLAFATIVIDTGLSSRRVARAYQRTLDALRLAEAGVEKAIACLNATSGTNCGGTYGASYAGETNVALNGGTFTTTISGSGTSRTIASVGTLSIGGTGTIKVDLTTLPDTDTPQFSYALQAGEGGAHLENNSAISGTIYANGDLDCTSTNAVITGDAFSAKTNGKVENCKVEFDAHADRVLGSEVDRDAYFRNNPADVAGSTVLGTKYPGSATPAVAPLPAINLQFWRDSAAAGGTISGNHSPVAGSSLGPIKIDGDLVLDNNVNVTITGPIWVVGNIVTGNNSSFSLAPSFGSYSTAILADDPADAANGGKIDITNNTVINGSGDPLSHLLFISTNTSTIDAAPALSVANNADGAVFFATAGTLRLQNNAGAKSLAGYRLFIDQNAAVSYVESEFSGQFSNSPGGTWHVKTDSWREVK